MKERRSPSFPRVRARLQRLDPPLLIGCTVTAFDEQTLVVTQRGASLLSQSERFLATIEAANESLTMMVTLRDADVVGNRQKLTFEVTSPIQRASATRDARVLVEGVEAKIVTLDREALIAVVDLSRGGFGFYDNRAYRPQTLFDIQLRKRGEVVFTRGRLRYSVEEPNLPGVIRNGVEFLRTKRLSEEDWLRLTNPYEGQERRKRSA